MNKITLVILCAGESSRFSLGTKKQWLRSNDNPLWLEVAQKLETFASFANIIIVGHKSEIDYMKIFSIKYQYVTGGDNRQESIKNALQKVTTKYVMVTDVARCCIPKKVIQNLIKNKKNGDCIVPILNVNDTVVYDKKTINRDLVKLIQTPQLSNTKKLNKALQNDKLFTDESSAIKYNKGKIFYIEGSKLSEKLTFGNELDNIKCLNAPNKDIFMGIGYDIHPFIKNKQMFLGGIKIQSQYGFKAHSDGDVLIHSVIDALLGAAGAGDIGEFFPDTDPKYKGADSVILLKEIYKFISNIGYKIVNIDIIIIAEIPKINPYKDKIRTKLAKILNLQKNKLNIKATTSEKMGFIGREEGVAVKSIAALKYYNWMEK